MSKRHRLSTILLIVAALLIGIMTLLASFTLLPAAPIAPTPTWPLGIDLPDKLPRIQP
jgi:hypothetical protein